MAHLRDGSPAIDHRLGRFAQFDPRSRNYPVRTLLAEPARQRLTSRSWSFPADQQVLDQGQDGDCVGCAVTNELRCTPVPIPGLDVTYAREVIYWGAQRRDDMPGGSYPGASPTGEGTSVLAGIQEATALGFYGEYRWAFSELDLALAVGHLGPAVIGINWYRDMSRLTRRGIMIPSGPVLGGHAVLVTGIDLMTRCYTITNSWGTGWGVNGTARIRRQDMSRLLREDGDACVVTVRLDPATTRGMSGQ